jgi:hypothetical protein
MSDSTYSALCSACHGEPGQHVLERTAMLVSTDAASSLNRLFAGFPVCLAAALPCTTRSTCAGANCCAGVWLWRCGGAIHCGAACPGQEHHGALVCTDPHTTPCKVRRQQLYVAVEVWSTCCCGPDVHRSSHNTWQGGAAAVIGCCGSLSQQIAVALVCTDPHTSPGKVRWQQFYVAVEV